MFSNAKPKRPSKFVHKILYNYLPLPDAWIQKKSKLIFSWHHNFLWPVFYQKLNISSISRLISSPLNTNWGIWFEWLPVDMWCTYGKGIANIKYKEQLEGELPALWVDCLHNTATCRTLPDSRLQLNRSRKRKLGIFKSPCLESRLR